MRDKVYRWGGLAASWGYDQDIYTVSRAGAALTPRTHSDFGGVVHPQYIGASKNILFAAISSKPAGTAHDAMPAGDIYRLGLSPGAGAHQPVKLTNNGKLYYCALSPDARSAAVADYNRILYSMSTDGSSLHQLGGIDLAAEPMFSRDGKYLYFLRAEVSQEPNEKWGLWRMKFPGGKPVQVANGQLFSDPTAWSRGHALARRYGSKQRTQP